MSAYPSTISNFEIPGYGIEPANPIARTEMEDGPARARRRYTSFPDVVSARASFAVEELAVFEAWHRLTVLDGEGWFDCNLINGLELNTVQARFIGVPKKSAISNKWFYVDAKLEVRGFPVLTQDYLDLGMAYSPRNIVYGAPLLHQMLHNTMPLTYSGYF